MKTYNFSSKLRRQMLYLVAFEGLIRVYSFVTFANPSPRRVAWDMKLKEIFEELISSARVNR